MKALLIGCGEGGSRLVEAIMKIQYATCKDDEGNPIKKQFDAIILNTAIGDLEKIDPERRILDENRRMLIGSGYTPAAGHGAGGNPVLGALAAMSDYWRIAAKIEEILSEINSNPYMGDIEAFIICAALGGGSGSGMGPVIAKMLKENYFEDQYPVIGLVILPAPEEGKLYAYNAYMSLMTWLKESNFDGIITVTLGGKFLNYKDDQQTYYARFDKSVAKALYILFGGDVAGKKAVNVDTSDILSTIKDGGGICTLGHLSTRVLPPFRRVKLESREIEPAIAGFEEEAVAPSEGWEAQELLKIVKRVCNKNNLFLPVDFRTAKAALMVVKDTEDFRIPTGALQTAANWIEENIDGVVRYSSISYENFKLITDDKEIFEDYEILPEDKNLSANESVEVAILFSGLQDIHLFKKFKEIAEKVERITTPSKGMRLVAESLGIPIGERLKVKFLPCSADRDNLAAAIQCRATEEAFNKFVEELTILNPDLKEEEIRTNIEVLDVIPLPKDHSCESLVLLKEKIYECFEIKLKFTNKNDNTYFKRNYIIKVTPEKIEQTPAGQRVDWRPPEFLRVYDAWDEKERKVIGDVLGEVQRKVSFRDADLNDLYVTGIAKYPSCSESNSFEIYKVKVANVRKIIGEITTLEPPKKEEERRKIVSSLIRDPCSGEHVVYFKYFYWVDADPQASIWECEDMEMSKIVELDRYQTPIDRKFTPDATKFETENLERIREEIEKHKDGYAYEVVRDRKMLEEAIRHTYRLDRILSLLERNENDVRKKMASIIARTRDYRENEQLQNIIKEQQILKEAIDVVGELKEELRLLKPKLKDKLEQVVTNTLERFLRDNIEEREAKLKALKELKDVLKKKPSPEQQEDMEHYLKRLQVLDKSKVKELLRIIGGE